MGSIVEERGAADALGGGATDGRGPAAPSSALVVPCVRAVGSAVRQARSLRHRHRAPSGLQQDEGRTEKTHACAHRCCQSELLQVPFAFYAEFCPTTLGRGRRS
jgi:hypothetical protein